MKRVRVPLFNFFFCLVSAAAFAQQEIIVNEFMYAPASGRAEWIELYNRSSQPVSVQNWILHDATPARPFLTTSSVVIPPAQYLVVAKDSSILEEFPDLAGMLLIMERFPSLNNTGDDVVLLRADSTMVDSVHYTASWGGSGGRSLERINPDQPGDGASNWATSVSVNTATPGERNSVSSVMYDLVIAAVTIEPLYPFTGSPATMHIDIRNMGTQTVDSFRVAVSEDLNQNGMAEEEELTFSEHSSSPLPSSGQMRFNGSIPASDSTERIFIATVHFLRDERPANNIFYDTVRFTSPTDGIFINEIMYAPTGGEPEWIELINNGEKAVDVSSWSIGDGASFRDLPETKLTIPAKGFLIISSSASILDYHDTIGCDIVHVSIPSLNNNGDDVRLRNRYGMRVDSVRYVPEWGGDGGCSIERKNVRLPSTIASNWATSIDPERSTPGRPNSNRTMPQDLLLANLARQERDLRATVKNIGLDTTAGARVLLYLDDDADRIPRPHELAAGLLVPSIAPSDSIELVFAAILRRPGMSTFVACIDYPQDMRHSNDTTRLVIVNPLPYGALTINEIMYAPLQDEAEWVEYYNGTEDSINIQGCSIADQPDPTGKRSQMTLLDTPLFVPSGGYLVVSSDSSVVRQMRAIPPTENRQVLVVLNRSSLGLGNTADEVVLLDPTGACIDSIRYSAAWHHPLVLSTNGISLEKLHPGLYAHAASSWSSATNAIGCTPGGQNSVYAIQITPMSGSDIVIDVHPNPFSPDHDGFEDFCVISYVLPVPVSQIRCRIFDADGHLVRTLGNATASGQSGELVWDGYDENRIRSTIGMYIVLFDAVDTRTHATFTNRAVLVVATRL